MAQTGSFIQIIQMTTDRYDEVDKLHTQYQQDMKGKTSAQLATVTKNLDTPNSYTIIVEFPDQKSAMENSNDPRTQELAEQMQKLATAPSVFQNLEVTRVDKL